ncbi:MAG TPA: NAD(P)/FAD-dependent oxidoreductase [Polyangiaceae bacterium]|nr:NAD(P)/FAD-dependent oxidoreductase [Polyangiaceae bacterium]
MWSNSCGVIRTEETGKQGMALHKNVVVIGGGFGGMAVTRALAHEKVQITLLDRRNHHLFQPLLYQVAMAGLSPAEIAVPIRSVLRKQKNVRVLLAEVTNVDVTNRSVTLKEGPPLPYDYLVVATGSRTNYFGHDWDKVAPGLKDLEDALEIRRRVLLAFEAAERETDPVQQRRLLTFVVIGGGPTGVELAGAIAELSDFVLARDFRSIHPESTRVILVEGGARVLESFSPELSEKATESLREMGVELRTQMRVTGIDERGIVMGTERIEASTVLWAAGVAANPLVQSLGAPTDRAGRVIVQNDCTVPGHPEVFVIGDAALFKPEGAERQLPGVSPVAIQQGRFVAKEIARRIEGHTARQFVYRDKGSMATIGRSRAVAEMGGLKLSGFVAWLFWLLVHIYYLIDFKNRLIVLINWAWAYVAYNRGARLITGREEKP